MRLRARLFGSYAAILTITVVLAGALAWSSLRFARTLERAVAAEEQARVLERLGGAGHRLEAALLAFIIDEGASGARVEDAMAMVEASLAEWDGSLESELELIDEDEREEEEEERRTFVAVSGYYRETGRLVEEVLELASESGGEAAADYLSRRLGGLTVQRQFAGILEQAIEEEQEEVARTIEAAQLLEGRLIALAVVLVILGMFGALLSVLATHRSVTRPLEAVTAAVRRIGIGDLGAEPPQEGVEEVRELARTLRWMAEKLRGRMDLERSLAIATTRNEELQEESSGKTTLVRELNHRVKNNLALINALISLKQRQLGEGVDLTDLRTQIEAVRSVHEELTDAERADAIELSSYLPRLARTLLDVLSPRRVTVDSTCSQVVVPPGKAVTVALILNEVITNTVKHGLPTQGEPRFHLELTGADGSQGTFRLRLGNNGPPIAEEVSLAGGDTLGMSIIANLAEQLGGEITLTKAPHPEFMLVAPVA